MFEFTQSELHPRLIPSICDALRYLRMSHERYHQDERDVFPIRQCPCAIAEAWRKVQVETVEAEEEVTK